MAIGKLRQGNIEGKRDCNRYGNEEAPVNWVGNIGGVRHACSGKVRPTSLGTDS